MLAGNPDAFAIWCDPVDIWSTDRFQNGYFGYLIGGGMVSSSRSTLGVDLHMLSRLHCMNHAVEDVGLFKLPPSIAYTELCMRAFPTLNSNVEVSDFSHLVSTESLSDEGNYVFLVECEGAAKLIYGYKENFNDAKEMVLMRGEFQKVVEGALKKSKDFKFI
jgi:hypothetical protein